MTARLVALLIAAAFLTAGVVQGAPLDQLIERLGSPASAERADARDRLFELGEAAVPILIEACGSPDPTLRWEAVNLLGMIGDPRGIDAALRLALSDPDVHVRWRANWALSRLDDGSVVPRLLVALADEDPLIRWNAAVALSLFGVGEAVPILLEGLEADGFQQWEAVNALGRVWDDETPSRLVALLKEGDEDVRKEAALSLGRIGGEEAAASLLFALASDPSPEVRWRAAMMIGRIGGAEMIAALRELSVSETDPFVLGQIEEAIERLTAEEGG